MPQLSYRNRKGQTWYLFAGRTKTGKPKYFLSMSLEASGLPLESLPPGHELYETPNGQVFCRRVQPQKIRDSEVEAVRDELSRLGKEGCIVERKGKSIIIHEPIQMWERGELESTFGFLAHSVEEMLLAGRQVQPVLKFDLLDEKTRVFTASRWCFRGHVDGWWSLYSDGPVLALAKRYVRHIGEESFYELV